MRNLILDEESGDIFTEDGVPLGSINDFYNKPQGGGGAPPMPAEPAGDVDVPDEPIDDDVDDVSIPDMSDDMPTPYSASEGLSETLIKRETEFNLPACKPNTQHALWIMFDAGIHQAMTNTSNRDQMKRAMELMHASIIASLADSKVAREMTPADYIQLHHWARNLVARSTTYEGDGLRDATILGRTLNPGVVDALRSVPERQKSGGSGGFFGFLKRS